jgi:hypothetical protein
MSGVQRSASSETCDFLAVVKAYWVVLDATQHSALISGGGQRLFPAPIGDIGVHFAYLSGMPNPKVIRLDAADAAHIYSRKCCGIVCANQYDIRREAKAAHIRIERGLNFIADRALIIGIVPDKKEHRYLLFHACTQPSATTWLWGRGQHKCATPALGGKVQAKTAAQNLADRRLVCAICHERDAYALGWIGGVMLKIGTQPMRPALQRLQDDIFGCITQHKADLAGNTHIERCHGVAFLC